MWWIVFLVVQYIFGSLQGVIVLHLPQFGRNRHPFFSGTDEKLLPTRWRKGAAVDKNYVAYLAAEKSLAILPLQHAQLSIIRLTFIHLLVSILPAKWLN